jgi:hypothetical protein
MGEMAVREEKGGGMSRYYTCAAARAPGYERLLGPPFRVIKHEPGYGVLLSFGEEGSRRCGRCFPMPPRLAAGGTTAAYFA